MYGIFSQLPVPEFRILAKSESRVEWPPKLRHGKMWKYGTVLKEGELGDEPSL
jgi:hypothetical protein